MVLAADIEYEDAQWGSDVCICCPAFREQLSKNFFICKVSELARNQQHNIQRTYLIPSIDDFWLEKQEETINLFRGQELVILGK